jgi:hypothetical protein
VIFTALRQSEDGRYFEIKIEAESFAQAHELAQLQCPDEFSLVAVLAPGLDWACPSS